MNLQGYRTFIVAGLLFIAPILARWGFQFDPVTVADAMVVIAPAVMAIMRCFTRTPVGIKE